MTRLQIRRPLAQNGDLTLPMATSRPESPGLPPWVWTGAAFGREQAANATATNQPAH
jgi:hypothetical protein